MVYIDENRCKGCGLCAEACPRKLLFLSPALINEKGYSPAVIRDSSLCIGCGNCYNICPDCAISIELDSETPAS